MAEYNEIRFGDKIIYRMAVGDKPVLWADFGESILAPAVQTFVAAAGITDPIQTAALNTLYNSLNADGIISKLYALYPFVGGNSTAHSYNLIDTTQYQISFFGSWTHNSNGITGDGSTTYANTFFIPAISPPVGFVASGTMGVYSRSSGQDKYDMGCFIVGNKQTALITRYEGALPGSSTMLSWPVNASVTQTDGSGLFVGNTNSSDTSTQGIWKNGSQIATILTTGINANSTRTLYIGGVNASGFTERTSRNYALALIGQGLTAAQQVSLYNAVQAYQTTLGREV